MKVSTILSICWLAASADAFQFMKGWKLPTRDKGQEAAYEKFGDKKLAVVTAAESPLGKATVQELLATGDYHVIGAYADMTGVQGMDNFTPVLCDPKRLNSVRDFCDQVHVFRGSKTVDRLVCLSGITCEAAAEAPLVFTKDGHEQTMQVNFLSNYLLISQLIDSMVDSPEARVTLVGESSRLEKASLLDMQGFQSGFHDPVAMADGASSMNYDSVKACEDSLLCQKLLVDLLHTKYYKLTGVVFNAVEAQRTAVAQAVAGGTGAQSGLSLVLDPSTQDLVEDKMLPDKAVDIETAYPMFHYVNAALGAEWPSIRQVTSPCPTLKVIGAITKGKVKREELKRMQQGRPGISDPIPPKKSKRQRVAAFADRLISTIMGQTVGRVARFTGKRVLGQIPETAMQGSYDKEAKDRETETGEERAVVTKEAAESELEASTLMLTEEDIEEIQMAISDQIARENMKKDFGNKKLVVMTGTSSGLGRKAALALLRTGEYHVIGAVRDLDKMEAVAEVDGFDMENFTPMYCEMNSFESVKRFCEQVNKFRGNKPLDRLVCNAGVYQPSLPYAKWSKDGHEQTMQINFLSHFLMISELMIAMEGSSDPRVTMVGSVTGNDNTVGGGGVYPIADLHDLDGFKAGFNKPIEMADGYGFNGAKAYKDSKLCLMMLANYLHTRYHKTTGIAFSSMYPGCIAESPLFREKRAWFRKYFPIFMKFITGGFVGEHEAGQRLFQVVHDPRCVKSGVYWSWNGGPREGRGAEAIEKGGQISGGGGAGGGWDSIFENDQSSKVLNIDTAYNLFTLATQITGAKWPYETNGSHQHLIEVTRKDVTASKIEIVPGSVLNKKTNMTASESAQS